jgi:SNF2 family DNA or RNA helicase
MRKQSDLRPYQQRLATFLYEHDEALCVVRPGGGKTAAALTAIDELIKHKVIRHALIIAPKRVAENVWPAELSGWEHVRHLRWTLLTGTPEERNRKLALAAGGDVTVIGLDNVVWLLERLEVVLQEHRFFDLLVIDEISKLKDPTGVRSKALAKACKWWKMIWGLSGTLRPNGPQDLFTPARVVTRGKLWGKSFYQWQKERFYPTDYMGYKWEPKPGEDARLEAEIAPYCTTLRADEYPQLPALSVQFDLVTLPASARISYNEMHKHLMSKHHDKPVVAANAAVATGKLAQIANGFIYRSQDLLDGADGLFRPGPTKGLPEVVVVHDEKRRWLEDALEQGAGNVLVIYQYRQDLKMIRDILGEDVPYLGAGLADKKAAAHITNWNAGQYRVMALHPASGGHGLNLQHGGSDQLWIAPTWSPEHWEQTIARLHRPGQTKPVVIKVCVAHNTVDEMKLDRVHFKMSEQQAFEKYLRAVATGSVSRS